MFSSNFKSDIPGDQKKQQSGGAISYVFLAGVLIASVGTLARPEYNLPLFIFGWIGWNYMYNQRLKIILLFLVSLVIDVIWFFVVARGEWGSDSWKSLAGFESTVQTVTIWCTALNVILKIICSVITYFDKDAKMEYEELRPLWNKNR